MIRIHTVLAANGYSRIAVLAVLAAAAFYLLVPASNGAPVWGEIFILEQPDGSKVEVRIWGDEFYRVVESLDGYTLVRDPATDVICYARLSADGQRLVSTGIALGEVDAGSLGLEKHIQIDPAARRAIVEERREAAIDEDRAMLLAKGYTPERLAPPNNGDVQGICLIVDFADEVATVPAEDIDDYCNLPGYTGNGNNGSVRDYFYDVSDGHLTYTNYVPLAYYRADSLKTYYDDCEATYGHRARELIIEALTDLDANGFDFSEYDSNGDGFIDAINCFYAGYTECGWANGLWPHSWTVDFEADGVSAYRYQITGLGSSLRLSTFCHENGHMICYWPDLYDYDGDSYGVGRFCIMASSTSSTNPQEPCAYFKEIAGWANVSLLTATAHGLTLPSEPNTMYKYEHPTLANEYYLIENRQQVDRDLGLPDAGLAIWHIDTEGNNSDQEMTPESHYLVTLVQADGRWDLEHHVNRGDETDLWAATSDVACTPYSIPNTQWWDGSASGLYVSGISGLSTLMTFDFNVLTNIDAGLPGVFRSGAAWGDYDDDGDLDILIAGETTSGNIARIYRNDGGSFTDIGAGLAGVANGALAWGDYDNDGDLDILLSGDTGAEYVTRIYRNDGGSFTDIVAGLPGVVWSAVAWGDRDNDGDLDIAISGLLSFSDPPVSQVYRNDEGVFVVHGDTLLGASAGSLTWGDADNDGDLDLLLTGDTGSGYTTRLYRNDGPVLTETDPGMPGVRSGSAQFGDYDNDGDADVLLTGNTGPEFVARVYQNNGGTFSDVGAGLTGIYWGTGVWGDYDNDGDRDILVTGQTGPVPETCLYRNDSGIFSKINDGLGAGWAGTAAWGDYDGDDDLDILLTGYSVPGPFAHVYENRMTSGNTVPSPPSNLAVTFDGDTATFSWDPATDGETPSDGLTYNLRVGVTPAGAEIMTPMSDPNDGYRKIVHSGNVGHNTEWSLVFPLSGDIVWSVQAVDGSYAGSGFAGEDTLVVTGIGDANATPRFALLGNTPNPFGASTAIRYEVGSRTRVTIRIYDVAGRLVRELANGFEASPGRNELIWDGKDRLGKDVSAGVYFYRLSTKEFSQTRRMVVVR